ncbi:MAG: hypothetical protein EOL86_12695 [Deltaproteobacteria bacterium]|nr:hypothetical protein [Deltaproteobacteria bacterium]
MAKNTSINSGKAKSIHIQVGYKAYNGAVLRNQASIDTYNRLTDEIEAKRAAGLDVDWLLDARHRHFVLMCEVARGQA